MSVLTDESNLHDTRTMKWFLFVRSPFGQDAEQQRSYFQAAEEERPVMIM
jgi:type II secretory pathway predicted ATPase ExeA